MAFINNKRQDPKKWKTQYENLLNELIRLLGTYNNIKHKWKSHQDKYWEVNWVFGVHVVHVILKRCPATLAKDLCYSAAWYKMQIQMWWPTTDMTVDEKDKKTKAKNPRIDSVASGVIHTTGQKQKQKKKERTISLEGIALPSNTGSKWTW